MELKITNLLNNKDILRNILPSMPTKQRLLIEANIDNDSDLLRYFINNIEELNSIGVLTHTQNDINKFKKGVETFGIDKIVGGLLKTVVDPFVDQVTLPSNDDFPSFYVKTSSGKEFECKFDVKALSNKIEQYHGYESQITDFYCDVNINNNWYPSIYDKNKKSVKLPKDLYSVFGLKTKDTVYIKETTDGVAPKNIFDKILLAVISIHNKKEHLATILSNKAQYSEVYVATEGKKRFYAYGWNVTDKTLQANKNQKINALCVALSVLPKESYNQYYTGYDMGDYSSTEKFTIPKEAIDGLIAESTPYMEDKIAKDLVEKQKEEARAKAVAQRKENIENGAIYFSSYGGYILEAAKNYEAIQKLIKPYGRYWTKEECEDMDDFYTCGWKYGASALDFLVANNYDVFVDDKPYVSKTVVEDVPKVVEENAIDNTITKEQIEGKKK